eukprot:12224.XXX_894900_895010_1 [CDS] Oithona nana genome sequencing.
MITCATTAAAYKTVENRFNRRCFRGAFRLGRISSMG